MRKPRRYPTLLELMRRGRQAAVASSGAIAVLASGCGSGLSGDVAFPEPDARDAVVVPDMLAGADVHVPDVAGPDDVFQVVDLAGAPDPGVPGPEDVGLAPDEGTAPDAWTEPDVVLAGAPMLPDPEPAPDAPTAQEDAP